MPDEETPQNDIVFVARDQDGNVIGFASAFNEALGLTERMLFSDPAVQDYLDKQRQQLATPETKPA